jgi:hypothetical protein
MKNETSGNGGRARLALDSPADDKQPLKVNIFEFMQGANSALIPLFPYLDEGAIVPCGTLFDGGPGIFYGSFEHFNDVDEVSITFAAEGSRYRPGFVRVGPRQHFVGNPFGPDDDQNAYALIVITQRQLVGRPQKERVIFRCTTCKNELLNHEFDATPAPRGRQRATRGEPAPFTTIIESVATYRTYNEAHRTCPKCGHVNERFPLELWGVDRYASQNQKVRRGRQMFEDLMTTPSG